MKRASSSTPVELSAPPPSKRSSSSHDKTVPVKLYNGVYWSKISELPHRFNQNALTLNELISLIRPVASIHFNFCVDAGFLISQYPPHLRACPITIVVGAQHKEELQQGVRKHFRNITVVGAPLPIPYGTHHTKLSIFESETALHVVVSTANLLSEDWEYKTQGFYHCQGSLDDVKESPFINQLCGYLEDGYSKTPGWDQIEYWRDRLKSADFSHIKDHIVYSVPGRFVGPDAAKYGHRMLRTRIQGFPEDLKDRVKKVIAQCSSIGSLGAEKSWFAGDFTKSLLGGRTQFDDSILDVIYPTVGNIRTSFEGYQAGSHFPYNNKNHQRQEFLMKRFHKWCSHNLGRSRAMPHIKTYTGLDADGKPLWFLLTSANLSKAAWGEQFQNGMFQIRSYELGVLTCALTPETDIRLPYDLPLLKYGPNEKPWLVDLNYTEPDSIATLARSVLAAAHLLQPCSWGVRRICAVNLNPASIRRTTRASRKVTTMRRLMKMVLCVLAVLSITILVLNIVIIRALRMNLRGMKALEITKMQVRDPRAPEYYKEEPVVRFMEKANLGHVILESGRVEGKGDKSLKVEGSRVILAGNENITRMVLQEGSCRLDGADTFRVTDFTGRTLFDAKNPAVTVDHRIKTIATNYIVTNKIRSPVNENLQFTVDNLILRGNQGVKSDSKTFNATAGTTLSLKTSGDGAIRVNARKMTMGTKFQTLPISASPALTASIDAYRLCVCISSHRPRLFTVQGNKPCHAPPGICS
ncbi:hypothetical protein QR680_015166 [Steinernema hermaphroditum]|uniref:PLD phosphodiesterase domain-containing protein n=1 Tax=Steinernema hermaphroditum TaxID=289476 RepID=A0AA39IBD9_9BILA|nr:hypothetical protein QR680_015166 [Steinernema hermaphroditum]